MATRKERVVARTPFITAPKVRLRTAVSVVRREATRPSGPIFRAVDNASTASILTASGDTMTQRITAANRSARNGIYFSRLVTDQGDLVDQQLKQLMKELGDAINESLSDSDQIAEVVSRIKDGGYDIFLVLEATIGVSKQGEKSTDKTSLVTTLSTNPEFKINDQDLKFLKSLRIKIEEEKQQ